MVKLAQCVLSLRVVLDLRQRQVLKLLHLPLLRVHLPLPNACLSQLLGNLVLCEKEEPLQGLNLPSHIRLLRLENRLLLLLLLLLGQWWLLLGFLLLVRVVFILIVGQIKQPDYVVGGIIVDGSEKLMLSAQVVDYDFVLIV